MKRRQKKENTIKVKWNNKCSLLLCFWFAAIYVLFLLGNKFDIWYVAVIKLLKVCNKWHFSQFSSILTLSSLILKSVLCISSVFAFFLPCFHVENHVDDSNAVIFGYLEYLMICTFEYSEIIVRPHSTVPLLWVYCTTFLWL